MSQSQFDGHSFDSYAQLDNEIKDEIEVNLANEIIAVLADFGEILAAFKQHAGTSRFNSMFERVKVGVIPDL